MTKSNLRRTIGAASALTMAAGMAATIGMGAASAAQGSVNWTETHVLAKYQLERTISNTTPSPGEVITVQTRFYNPPVDWYIQNVKDIHNPCLTYVEGSANFNGVTPSNVDPKNPDPNFPDIAYVSAKLQTGSFKNRVGMNSKAGKTFEVKYTVGDNCARGIPLDSTVHFGTNLFDRADANKGPSITVAKSATTTGIALDPAPQADKATTLTATVAPATATGKVEFLDGTTKLGEGTLSSGTATYNWTPGTAGKNYSITAKYLGDAKNNPSTSSAQTGTVSSVPVVKPGAPAVTLDKTNVQVGDTVKATITTVPGATVAITIDGVTQEVVANSSGVAIYQFQPTKSGTTDVMVTATNSGGTSDPTNASVEVTAAPAGQAIVSVNPTAPIAGDTVKVSVSGADADSNVSIKVNGQEVCTATTDANGAASCDWKTTTAGTYNLTATTTVGGAEKTTDAKTIIVSEKAGDGGNDNGGSGSGDTGSASIFGSLGNVFGSLS